MKYSLSRSLSLLNKPETRHVRYLETETATFPESSLTDAVPKPKFWT